MNSPKNRFLTYSKDTYGYPYGVWAEHKEDSIWKGELHGPFRDYDSALKHAAALDNEYEDYLGFTIVKIETPAASQQILSHPAG